MQLREIKEKSVWEEFLMKCSEKTFLDSWCWGEFHQKNGGKIWRFGTFHGDKLIAVILVTLQTAKRGRFLLIPHGPVVIPAETGIDGGVFVKELVLRELLAELKKIGKNEGASFIRMGPLWENNEKNLAVLKKAGFKIAPTHAHYEATWKLDIKGSEEEILGGMRKTTRYLIKHAEKNPDIEITKSQDIADLKKFSAILSETVKKHKFSPFREEYLSNEFEGLAKDNSILIFFGKYKGEIVSSAIIVFWQNIAFYHHGASLSEYNSNKTPVSYLLQWESIKEAKKLGCQTYDFWGVLSEKDLSKKHPWAGFSQFKMGFGGKRFEYIKTQDYILSPKYYITNFIERIRKIKRRL